MKTKQTMIRDSSIYLPNVKGMARREGAQIDQTASSASPSPACSAFWWIAGTVQSDKGRVTLPARKHRIFRFVQAWSWGKWNGIRDEYPEIPESFKQNVKVDLPPKEGVDSASDVAGG